MNSERPNPWPRKRMAEKGHTVRLKKLLAGSEQCRIPIAPCGQPTGYGEGLSPGPRTTPGEPQGLDGTRPRRPRPGSGHNDPRNPGKGSPRQFVTRNGQPGTTPPRTLPGDGGVGESQPGRRNPGAPRPGPPRDEPRSGDGRDGSSKRTGRLIEITGGEEWSEGKEEDGGRRNETEPASSDKSPPQRHQRRTERHRRKRDRTREPQRAGLKVWQRSHGRGNGRRWRRRWRAEE